jgi:CRISPR-associated protein Cas1
MLSVQSLHALAYCERLFYLEEVEHLRLADAAVYAGRRLHAEMAREDEGEWHTLTLESKSLGLRGKVDCLRRRDGHYIPYEHKRGRAATARHFAGEWGGPAATAAATEHFAPASAGESREYEAWASDQIQVCAYAMLVEEATGRSIPEARVRYHQTGVTVRVPVDEPARAEVLSAIERARQVASSIERPPVTSNEKLCTRCSLAPACLPEEARAAAAFAVADGDHQPSDAPAFIETESDAAAKHGGAPLRLFPPDDTRQALHIITPGARVGRASNQFEVSSRAAPKERHPVNMVGQIVLHGFAQITTQALRLCAEKQVGVHWLTQGGGYLGSFSSGVGSVQRRMRQYEALRDDAACSELGRKLVEARVLSQLRFLLRASRGVETRSPAVVDSIKSIRRLLPLIGSAVGPSELRGIEGRAGACYFAALPDLISRETTALLRPDGRTRRPPADRFNAMLGFGYALLLKDVMSAILVVGLDPSIGFFHTPRSQAQPLALDLIELFRVPLVDMPVVASINRQQWDADLDFQVAGRQVWLSEAGRRKLIEVYERRKMDKWKHPVLGYSLSYSRAMELETRLLEKEWSGEPGLFARMRLR